MKYLGVHTAAELFPHLPHLPETTPEAEGAMLFATAAGTVEWGVPTVDGNGDLVVSAETGIDYQTP